MKVEIDHVAFLVHDLARARADFPELRQGRVDEFPAEGTREQYLGSDDQPARVLLLEARGEGPYASALERRGVGLHHVALRVDDLDGFVAGRVEESGWFLHPRSLATRMNADTVWLTRTNVETLVEVTQNSRALRGAPCVERVTIAGLAARPGLARVFDGCAVPVVDGPASGVVVAGKAVWAPGAPTPKVKDPFMYNRRAWNQYAQDDNRWTIPVSRDEVARARRGSVEVVLTPTRRVPQEWLGNLSGRDVLCLASGGGQQGPLLAAAGARVTVFDASDEQLARDEAVARRDGLDLRTVLGDMRDLGAFADASFDLVFHPCSNVFVDALPPVWRECFRVLRPRGELLSGFSNPVSYCFDWGSVERGSPRLRFPLPYRDVDHLDVPWVARMVASNEPVEFAHSLSDQIGGQLDAGFQIVGFYEDRWGDADLFPDPWFDGFIATRALKTS